MKNKEKFADEIVDFACRRDSIAVDNKRKVTSCLGLIRCKNCRFREEIDCKLAIKDWLEEEYVEPPVISKKDKVFLEYLKDGYKYITRDYTGGIFLHINKPKRISSYWFSTPATEAVSIKPFDVDFPMIKWEDEEPWKIDDLEKLEVVDKYE